MTNKQLAVLIRNALAEYQAANSKRKPPITRRVALTIHRLWIKGLMMLVTVMPQTLADSSLA